MTVRVAVTGHRWNRIARQDEPTLRRRFQEAFHAIASTTPDPIVIVCGMAEGADLIAAAARPSDWGLEAALPLPVPLWRDHLHSTSSPVDAALFDRLLPGAVVHVLPHEGGPDFVALAHYLAATCDRVIAAWDGSRGLPGGTGDVVSRFRDLGKPELILPLR